MHDIHTERNSLLDQIASLWQKAMKKPTVRQFNQVSQRIAVLRSEVGRLNGILRIRHFNKVGG